MHLLVSTKKSIFSVFDIIVIMLSQQGIIKSFNSTTLKNFLIACSSFKSCDNKICHARSSADEDEIWDHENK